MTVAVEAKELPAAQRTQERAQQRSPGTFVVVGKLHRARKANGQAVAARSHAQPPKTVYKPTRVARMLAFAHHLKRAIRRGEYVDRTDAARALELTKGRLSQLLDLTLLAPEIQEEVLFSQRVDGIEKITERQLRPILRELAWRRQRYLWALARR